MALSALANPQVQPSAPGPAPMYDSQGNSLPGAMQYLPPTTVPAMVAKTPDGATFNIPAYTSPPLWASVTDSGQPVYYDTQGNQTSAPNTNSPTLPGGTQLYGSNGQSMGSIAYGDPMTAGQAFMIFAGAVAGGAFAGASGLGGAGAAGGGAAGAPVLGGNLDALAGSGAFGVNNVGLAGSEFGAAGGAGGYDLTGNLANLATNPANYQVAGDATGTMGGGSLSDLATQAGDIGGAAFPTDAATIAGQQGTLGALGTAGADVIGPNGLNGYDPTMSGAPGNVNAGLQNYVQGALQSGDYSQLTKLLPSLPTGSQTALQRIMSGNGSAADYAQLGLQALPGVLGAVGQSQQAGALSNLAQQQFAVGAPSRARYEASMTPGFDPTTIPGYSGALDSTSQAVLSKLSASGGNPYGNPGGLISANQQIVNGTALPAIQNYESQNAATGGYTAFNSAAPNTATQAIGSQGGVLSALGSAASSVVNPPQTLADLLKQYGLGSASNNQNTLASGASLQ